MEQLAQERARALLIASGAAAAFAAFVGVAFVRQGTLPSGVVSLALAAWCGRKAMAALERLHAPLRDPGLQALARFGPLADVVTQVNVQAAAGDATRVGRFRLYRDWWVPPPAFSLEVLAFRDVLWLYQRVTTTKAYGLITMSRSVEAVVHVRGRRAPVVGSGPPEFVERLLAEIAHRAPWADRGFDTSREAMMRTPEGWARHAATVDARRERMHGPPPG